MSWPRQSRKIRAVLNNGLRELNRGMAGKSAFSLNQSLMKEISDSAACYELAVLDVIDAMPEPPGLAAGYSAMKDEQIRPRLREGMRKTGLCMTLRKSAGSQGSGILTLCSKPAGTRLTRSWRI